MVNLPPLQTASLMVPLEICPIRAPRTFAIVDEWRLPSSVRGHRTVVPRGSMNSRLDHVALMFLLLVESLPADAPLTSALNTMVAPTSANRVLAYFDMGMAFRR